MAKELNGLNDVLAKINKDFGAGTITFLGETKPVTDNVIPTGSLMLDKCLGGGIAGGRVIELYGMESTGKSSLALQIATQVQKAGGVVAYIDVENACDIKYAAKLGVDVSNLIFTQPDTAEQALDIAEALINSGKVKLIIVDSTAALCPQAELDGEMGDATIGLMARLMSKFFRKTIKGMNENNCSMIFINQLRDNIGTYGGGTTTPGGKALKFFASQRIELRKGDAIKEGADTVIGNLVKFKVSKNKIAPPMMTCVIPMIFGQGFSPKNECIDLAIEYGLIDKAGSWLTTHDGVKLQGKSAIQAYYESNPNAMDELLSKVKGCLNQTELVQDYTVDPVTGEIIE